MVGETGDRSPQILDGLVYDSCRITINNDCDRSGAAGAPDGGQLLLPISDIPLPFYGAQPTAAEVAKIKAPLLIHNAELDSRIMEGWPAYESALKANHVKYTEYTYPKANHGFHNDTTPRYDEAAAKLAWSRTLTFFTKYLR